MPNPRLRPPTHQAALITVWLLVLLCVGAAEAHQRLVRSEPAADARLDVVPTELRLTFGEPVGIALTRIELIGPDGVMVQLGSVEVADGSANEVVVAVRGGLSDAGAYQVAWRTVGPDGHPAQGTFVFEVAEGASGLAPAAAEPTPNSDDGVAAAAASDGAIRAEAFSPRTPYGVNSPTYVAIRWFTYLCLVGLLGVVVFRGVVLRLVARSYPEESAGIDAQAAARARAIGLAITVVLVPVAGLRLVAQTYAVAGGAPDVAMVAAVLGGTAWGWGWWIQSAATLGALVGLWLAGRWQRAGWSIAAVSVALLALTPALSGHAIAATGEAPLALVADAVHVIGAGGWLGTLAIVVAAGMPPAIALGDGGRGHAVRALIGAFSHVALIFAGALVATGVYASWLHLGGIEALWSSDYGRALSIKLAALALVFGMGAYNFLRVRPMLGDEAGVRRIRRTSLVGLTVGVLVLIITAVLVATPPATETHDVPETSTAEALR